jgi:hypothetical protein
MAYIGQSIKNGTFSVLDTSGNTYNGSNTTFSLGTQVGSAAQLLVSHDGVIQKPGTDYTLASGGASITFTTAPASGASIFIVEISGAVGGTITPSDSSVTSAKLSGNLVTPGTLDVNGQELILDADGDTSITADTDDQIDFKVAGNDRVKLNNTDLTLQTCALRINNSTTGTTSSDGLLLEVSGSDVYLNQKESASIFIRTNNTDRKKIDGNGQIFTGLSSNFGTDPTTMTGTGKSNMMDAFANSSNLKMARAGDSSIQINRTSDDGNLMIFRQDGTNEGTIAVSGTTINYNGFTGTHWSRLGDNSKPTILKGTILESLDEMMDWYQITFDIGEGGEENILKISHTLQEGQSVGDTITYNHNGVDYTATIIKEDDIKHSKCKVSDTTDSKAVYGVFVSWDEDDDDGINDIYIAQTGTFVVRLNSSVTTLNKGDLIQSNGDGTGKVQADDIIRASTVAKVLSTTKIETYSDGSYIVPCSLHC